LKPQIPQIRGEGQTVSNGARDTNGARDRSRCQKEKSSHGGYGVHGMIDEKGIKRCSEFRIDQWLKSPP